MFGVVRAVCVSALLLASIGVHGASVSERTAAAVRLDKAFSRAGGGAAAAAAAANVHHAHASATYNIDVANKLFWHSTAAYCTDLASVADWSCRSCKQFGDFTITQVMNDTDNAGYVGFFTQGLPASPMDPVAADEPFVLVSFRGTVPADIDDWIEDLSYSKTTSWPAYPGVGIHSGFWGAYNSMKADMVVGIQKALQASGARAILFTGHSLGAAMAELAALDMKLNNYPSYYMGAYTQGCPRPGDANFATLYNANVVSYREIHYADVVPHLPLEMQGFAHTVVEVWWNEPFSSYKVCNATNGEDQNCSDSLSIAMSVDDHTHYRNIDVGHYCDNTAA